MSCRPSNKQSPRKNQPSSELTLIEITPAYKRGVKAKKAGLNFEDNPYRMSKHGVRKSMDWLMGYHWGKNQVHLDDLISEL